MTPARAPAGAPRGVVVTALAGRLGSVSEARWLVDHVSGLAAGAAPAGAILDEGQLAVLATLVERRASGEPLQYVLGSWPFRFLDLGVDRRALIPRPETEQVVEVAIGELRRGRPRPEPGGPVVVDLGTGTGAIALSLAVELVAVYPELAVWAVDDDPDALALAVENRERVATTRPGARVAGRVRMVPGHWYDALPGSLERRVALVVANPPYVAGEEWAGLDPAVQREPHHALVAAAGSDGTPGLGGVEAVLAGAPRWLAPGGAVVVELAPHQAAPAAALARRVGFRDVEVAQDLAGRDRAVVARG